MANIKKNFNFRNGVQVDDDNLLVTSTGLVGIGTTIPTEALDVRGNVNISGVTSISNAIVGVLTATEASPDRIIGAGVSIVSGIVTASGTGIITFFGDASNLLGMPTSQWEDVNIPGFGFTSIYNTGGNVGIATTDPRMTLQVGPDPRVSGQKGVGISSFGEIIASGVVTATTFSGDLIGNVTGNVTGTVSGPVISGVVTITDTINATNINVSGLSTFAGITSVTGPVFHSNQLDISGISTMRGGVHVPASGGGDQLQIGFVKNNLIDVTGIASIGTRSSTQDLHLSGGGVNPGVGRGVKVHSDLYLLKQLDVIGGSTFRNQVAITQGSGGITLSALSGDISAGGFIRGNTVKGDDGVFSNEIAIGRASVVGVVGHPRMIHTTQNGPLKLAGHQSSGVEVEDLLVSKGPLQGLGNIIANSNSGKIGVGTISPVSDIQVRRYSGDAEIQVTSEAGASRVSLGVESGTGQTDHAELRYNLLGLNQFDGNESFSIVNFGRGNFNYMMSAANSNAATGNFFWMKGNGLSGTLMTLTPTGRLGIGLTTPSTPLHVQGGATISGSLSVGNNLIISGTLNANLSGNVTGNLTGNVNGNANANAGISTFNNISASGIATITSIRSNSIGIGVAPSIPLSINSNPDNRFFVNANGNVGIKTTSTDGNQLLVGGSISTLLIGVGTTQPLSSVDFSLAGQSLTGQFANKMFMIPPKVSGTGTLAGVVSGALVYNTSTNTIQVYNGTSWGSLGSGGGGGEANQNAFSNVAVAGQSTVAADSTTDTLTLVAGSNVTITTNASNDTVTIAASGGGGGGGISNVVEDTSPQLGGDLDVQAREINTSTTNGNIKLNPNGTGVVEVRGAGGNDGTLQLNCSAQSHGIKLKSPPHSAGASYTLTFPNNVVDGQFLKTNGSGTLSWDSRLGAGFVNAADYGLDASATSGSTNLDAINAAITALGTNGGTIFFPGGMFYLSGTISLGASNNSIRFVGSGHQNYGGGNDSGGTVLRKDADNEFFNITNSRAIHFIGITFKGGSATNSNGTGGVSGGTGAITVNANAGCQGHLYENLVFHGIKNCINLNGLSDSIIRGCRFRNPPTGKGTGAFITMDDNNYSPGPPESGERLDQIRIENCIGDGYIGTGTGDQEFNNQVDGIHIKGYCNTIFVTNSSFIRLNRCYYIDNTWTGEFLYFTNAEAERAAGQAGFLIDSGGTSTQGNFITLDNCFSSSCGVGATDSHGIQLAGTLDASVNITNCNVRGNRGHGIVIDSDGGNTSIVNPIICGNSANSSGTNHGIFIGNDVDDVYIGGGRIGGDVSVKGTGNQGRGILVNGSSHTNIRIIGVNVTGNQNSEGISASLGGGTTGNKFQFNSGSTLSVNT